jgi:glutamate-1-semialdehyde aminotransferase
VLTDPHPVYVAEGHGAWITDVEGRRLLDANNNYTSIILGHGDSTIDAAVRAQLERGTAYSMATTVEIELAELLCDRVETMDQIRFCNSGTEAVMGAIKAARAFTGRPMIVKVEGSYHGTYDHAEDAIVNTAREVGALVILDEVISFRLGPGGAQALLGLEPDLTCVAKIIGGGFPVGGVGGRSDVMAVFAKQGGQRAAVPSGGTFTANPVTMTAGLACMQALDSAAFARLDELGERSRSGLRQAFDAARLEWQVHGRGSLFCIHPNQRTIRSFRDARHTSDEAVTMMRLHQGLLDRQVLLSNYGMGCWNLATSDDDIDLFVDAVVTTAAENS